MEIDMTSGIEASSPDSNMVRPNSDMKTGMSAKCMNVKTCTKVCVIVHTKSVQFWRELVIQSAFNGLV